MPVISTLTNKNGSLYNARMKKANEKSNVEISYLFQFDRIEHSDYTEIKIEIFHNGMDEAFIQNNILNVIQSHLPNVHYYFD
nr:hypothetical protein [uncultured Moraxella sp.]